MQVEWKEWWRELDGQVFWQKGFTYDGEWYFFGVDPDAQTEPIDEHDPHRVHVDDLFDDAIDVRARAQAFLEERVKTYQLRLAALYRT